MSHLTLLLDELLIVGLFDFRKVNAVEINQRRFNTLCETVEKSGATCVKAINGDVLRHSNDMSDVEYILLDPPCSGSGNILFKVGSSKRLIMTVA